MRALAALVMATAMLGTACTSPPPARQYEVKGQIIGINPERQEVLVSHEDIPGFMAAMTMPYKVQDAALLEGKTPGDLVTATLVVEEVNAYLSTLTKTGHAPVPDNASAPLITASDLLAEGDVVPDHVLVDQERMPRLMVSLRGHRVALTFMYTRCPLPDFCPRMDRNFAEVQAAIKATPELADVRLVSVTLDPEFDTPAVLKTHAAMLKADPAIWYFVTGDRQEVMTFAKGFGVTAEPGEPGAMMVHNLRTAVIDPDGRLVKLLSGNMWTPAELVADSSKRPPLPRAEPANPPGLRFTPAERRLIERLRTPQSVQDWLNELPYNVERGGETLRTFRGVARTGTAHCLEAALTAAVILEQHRYPPLLLSFESIDLLDHVIFVYRGRGGWGSVARSRDPGLHGRKPLFATPRALALSYFEGYIDFTGRIKAYAVVDLRVLGSYDWRLAAGNVWKVERLLLDWPHRGIASSDSRADRLRRRYRAFREANGYKPWKYYSGRERWTGLPPEFRERG